MIMHNFLAVHNITLLTSLSVGGARFAKILHGWQTWFTLVVTFAPGKEIKLG